MRVVKRRACFVFGLTLAFARTAFSGEPPDRFAGLTWGEAPAADMVLTGRVAFEKPSRTAFYAPKERVPLAGVKVRASELAFEDGRLAAAFLSVGSPAAVWADSSALDASWGAHTVGAGGFATWRSGRTVAVLVEPEATGGRGAVVAIFPASASDDRIAARIRGFARRAAAGAVAYDTNARLPAPHDQQLNDQFRQELQPLIRSNPPQK